MKKWIALAVAVTLAVPVVFYVVFAHPNDARLAFEAPASRRASSSTALAHAPAAAGLERVVALLREGNVQFSAASDAVAAARAALQELHPDAIIGSHRFGNDHVVYVPVGSYPWRLDGRDAWLIPPGASVTTSTATASMLRYAAIAPRGGSLTLRGAATADDALAPLPPPINLTGFWRRQVLQFITLDRSAEIGRWQDVEVPVASNTDLSFTCAPTTALPGCLVAEPTLYRPATKRPPNVLVILVDTLRGDGPFGGNAPAMAELARASTVFTNALAPGNMTSPSTNALLSCRRPSQLGRLAFAYGTNAAQREAHYAKKEPSFPAGLRAVGYDTAMIGNVSVISEIYGVGVNHGFSRQIALERDGYDTVEITREALAWLDQNREQPFFLYVHYNGPHAPYRAPWRDLAATYPGREALGSYPGILKWLYQGEVRYTDRYLTHVIEALKASGRFDDTLIVLTADHGDQHAPRSFPANETGRRFEGAYFDHGATLYNDEIRVPLFVKMPGQTEGRDVASFVQTLDIGPTLYEALGLPVPEACAGKSLMPLLRGGTLTPELAERTLGSEGFRGRAIVFDQRYKYVRTYEPTDKLVFRPDSYVGARELFMVERQVFDLAEDPDETRDLAATRPDLVAKAETLYRETFGIYEAFEVVIEAPKKEAFEVVFPEGTSFAVDDAPEGVVVDAAARAVRGSGVTRLVVSVTRWAGAPQVVIDGAAAPLAATSMRLPLAVAGGAPTDLPLERAGPHALLALAKTASAYVRRVEIDGQAHRRIVAGNPRFEKVLREWGYLNDR